MLVLARRINQSVMIGDDIRVEVVEIRGEQVKLGFTASRDIPVYRTEIYRELEIANREASKALPADFEAAQRSIDEIHEAAKSQSSQPRDKITRDKITRDEITRDKITRD